MRYFQIGINRKATRDAFNEFVTETWNAKFFDQNGKFVNSGSKLIREQHKATWEAIIVKYKIEILRINKKNSRRDEQIPHSTTNITVKYKVFDIMRIMSQGLFKSVSRETVRDYIKRLAEAGVLEILSNNGQYYFARLNDKLVYLFDKETDKKLTNSKYLPDLQAEILKKKAQFLNSSKSIDNKEKNEDARGNTVKELTILRNKEIENDKSYLRLGINDFSHKQEPNSSTSQPNLQTNSLEFSKKQEQTSEIKNKNSMNPIMREHEEESLKLVPSYRFENVAEAQKGLNATIKKYVVKFWLAYINVFWELKSELFDYETAPPQYFSFIDQGLNALTNDPMYFGTCNTERRVQLQYIKLKTALRATKRWYDVRKAGNPKFNFDKMHPNKFLMKGLNEKLAFKKSVVYTENAMERKQMLDRVTENFIIEKRYNELTDHQQHEINSLIYTIFSEKGAEKQKLMWQDTKDYIAVYRPELWDGLRYALRPDRVQAFMLANKSYKIEFGIVTNCICNKEMVREQIQKLIPHLESKIDKKQVVLKDAQLHQYFKLQLGGGGERSKVLPHQYNQNTLNKIHYYINPENK